MEALVLNALMPMRRRPGRLLYLLPLRKRASGASLRHEYAAAVRGTAHVPHMEDVSLCRCHLRRALLLHRFDMPNEVSRGRMP